MHDELGWLGSPALEATFALALQCRNSSGTPTAPDAAPTWIILNSAGTTILTGSLGSTDTASKTGLRIGTAALTAANGFASGSDYTIVFSYLIAAASRTAIARLHVI